MSFSKLKWLAGTAVLAAAGITAGWILWPGAEPDPYPDRPEGVYAAAAVTSFTDVATMTATSALVVQGTVIATGVGETIERNDGSGSAWTNREVTIAVEDVLYSRYEVEEPTTVVMIEGHWEYGLGYAREGVPWVEVGNSGYFYLGAPPPERRDSETYGIINTYGRVLLEEDQTVTVPGHWKTDGPWAAASLDAADASTFENHIRAAAEAASAGLVEPELVSVCEAADPDNENEQICWEE